MNRVSGIRMYKVKKYVFIKQLICKTRIIDIFVIKLF